MEYREFKEVIVKRLQQVVGDEYNVVIQKVPKNNNVELDGVTILERDINIAPTIYLNPYYEQYLRGFAIESIIQDIYETYKANKPEESVEISFFLDYEKVKERIMFKVINAEKNEKLLEDVPHKKILDLAIVFCYVFPKTDDNGQAVILIHNSHMNLWNVTTEDLLEASSENTPKCMPYRLSNMFDLMLDCGMMELDDSFSECIPMWVLSNDSKMNGAGCIFYKNLLAELAEKMNSNIYILPSSVHETILIPVKQKSKEDDNQFDLMVKEVNETQLADVEILSDHAYFYDRELDEIVAA